MTQQIIAPLPSADDAEQAIIATIFANPSVWLPRARAAGITSKSFYVRRRLFDLMVEFYEAHGDLEIVAFVQHLKTIGKFDSLGGGAIIETIQFSTLGTFGWPKWIEQVQEAYALRIARTLPSNLEACQDSDEAGNMLKAALETIATAKKGPSRSVNGKEATQAFIKHFTKLAEAGEIPGRSTGIQPLDVVSGGMRNGELWVIGGKTSRGKSVLMLQLAAEVLSSGGKVAIFSLELGRAEIVARLISCIGRIHFGSLSQPRGLKKHELERIQRTIEELAGLPHWIDDSANQTLDHICAEAETLRDNAGGLDLIVVDYVQLVTGDKARGESREQEVSRISRGLKQLAKQIGCPVVTASQLNDDGKLRESRAIGHDSDALLVIAEDGVMIGKLRNGRRGDVLPITLRGDLQRFVPCQPKG